VDSTPAMLARGKADSLFEAGDHDVDEAAADVLFVEFLASTLHVVLSVEEDQGESSLLTLPHLNHDVVVVHVEIGKEILNVILRCLVGDASQLHTPMQVLLVQEIL